VPSLGVLFQEGGRLPTNQRRWHEVSYQVSADVIRTAGGSPCGDFPFGTSGDSATGMQSLDSFYNSLQLSTALYNSLQLYNTQQLSVFANVFATLFATLFTTIFAALSTALYSSLMTKLYSSFYKHYFSHRYAVARLFYNFLLPVTSSSRLLPCIRIFSNHLLFGRPLRISCGKITYY
jgi:hypothetical protein